MPQTRECDYCGADIEPGTGTMFVQTNGATVHFCSAKCEKNADLGREARDLSWTNAGRGTGGEADDVTEPPVAEATDVDETAADDDAAADEDETPADVGGDDETEESSEDAEGTDVDGEDSADGDEEAAADEEEPTEADA